MTTILVCADARVPDGLEISDARVVVVDDLCRQLPKIGALVADDESRLVVAIHSNHIDLGSVQAAVRRIGFNPLGVGIVDLQTVGASADMAVTLVAAMARSASFVGAEPEQVKLLPPDRSTRRSLLSVGKQRYIGAPTVDASACHAADGCRVCVTNCPFDALSWVRGSIEHDINACVVCGICVTSCPAGAIENPTSTRAGIESEIRAAIEHAGGPIGIRFRCRGATVPAEQGWYQVELPCTGMLTPGWVLAPIAMGANSVDVIACSSAGCQLRNGDRTTAMLADAVAIADRFGLSLDPTTEPPLVRSDQRDLLGKGASSTLIDLLAPPGEQIAMKLDVTDVGSVSIDPETCTACERCARVCPAGALLSAQSENGIEITFDPSLCTACDSCLDVCPEIEHRAIEVNRGFDLAERAGGRRQIRQEPTAMCEICGGPVAPAAMLARIEAMLGEDAAATMTMISRRCLNCRGR